LRRKHIPSPDVRRGWRETPGEVKKMIEASRELRKSSIDAEQLLWQLLRNRKFYGYRFKRQYVIKPYIVDFFCSSSKLIIELDGSQHLDNKEYDDNRTLYLECLGYGVIRFWNNEVLQSLNFVLEVIYNKLK